MSLSTDIRKKLQEKEIWFARHGESEHNIKIDGMRQIMGAYGSPDLTEQGRAQARKVGQEIQALQPQLIVHSPLKRVRSTIKEILSQLDYEPRVVSFATLHEINCGDTEGTLVPGPLQMLKDMPGAETPAHLESRAVQALEYIARQPEKKVVIVAHSRIGRMLFFISQNTKEDVYEFDAQHEPFDHDSLLHLDFK